MKIIALVFATVLVAVSVGCHPNPANYTHPAGYKSCQTNFDCPKGTYCGFVGVDTYPVCKQ